MKKLLFIIIVTAFCIPASAELVIYKISCREKLFDPSDDCPENVVLNEKMLLILDIDPAEVQLLECGDQVNLGHPAVPDAQIFKTWKLGRQKLWDDSVLTDPIALFVFDDQVFFDLPVSCNFCFMEGRTRGADITPRNLYGCYVATHGQVIGEGTCRARLDKRTMRSLKRKGITTVDDALDYLVSIQPDDAIQGSTCDLLSLP